MARDTFDTRSGLHRVLAFFDVTGGGLGTNIGAGIYALIAAAAATRAASARPPVSTSVGSICTRNQGDSPKRIPEGPKVIGIRQRNAPSDAIATLLRHSEADIAGFMAHPEAARLPLGRLTSDA